MFSDTTICPYDAPLLAEEDDDGMRVWVLAVLVELEVDLVCAENPPAA